MPSGKERSCILRALIVDDEPAARSEIRYLLETACGVQVLGEAATANEALELLRNISYDVVFLDIHLPGLSGTELADEIKKLSNPPAIVFITAYGEHAVEAFELEAMDYVVKPVSEKRLKKSVERIKRSQASSTSNAETRIEGKLDRLFVDIGGKKVPLSFDDIYIFEAQNNYARVYTKTDSYLISPPLKELEVKLVDRNFIRVHRKYLVNIEKISEIVPLSKNAYILRLSNTERTEIPVSRRRKKLLKEVLGI